MGNAAAKKIISWLLLASVFITGGTIASVGFTVHWFHFIYLPFAVLCLIIFHRFDARIGIILIVVLADAVLMPASQGIAGIKQFVNIALSAWVFYGFLCWENFDFEEIFRKYISLSKIILVIGFLQVACFALQRWGIPAGDIFVSCFPFLRETNITVRLQSIAQEPSEIAFALAPVVFLSFHNLVSTHPRILSRTWTLLFLAGYLLTFSLIAYAGLLLIAVILYFKNFSAQKAAALLLFVGLMGTVVVTGWYTIPEVRIRIDDTIFGMTHDITEPAVYKSDNLSSYSLLSNAHVTRNSVRDHPILGSGLGSYEDAWKKYLPPGMRTYSDLNSEDADSLAFRLLVEWGLTGFFLFCFFTFSCRIGLRANFTETHQLRWIMSNGIFILILLFLIRSGNYTHQGKMFFFFLYYYLWKEDRA